MQCKTHGWQPASLACTHLLEAFADERPIPAFLETNPDRTQAWCYRCKPPKGAGAMRRVCRACFRELLAKLRAN